MLRLPPPRLTPRDPLRQRHRTPLREPRHVLCHALLHAPSSSPYRSCNSSSSSWIAFSMSCRPLPPVRLWRVTRLTTPPSRIARQLASAYPIVCVIPRRTLPLPPCHASPVRAPPP